MLNYLRLTAPVIDPLLFFFLFILPSCFLFGMCMLFGFEIEIFTIQCTFGKYLLTCVGRFECVSGLVKLCFFFFMKSVLNRNSQSAFHRNIYIGICFCSIVCLLREQIKLNRCERLWPFVQSSDTVFVFGYLFIFGLILVISNFFYAKETKLENEGIALTFEEIQSDLELLNKNPSRFNLQLHSIC